MAFEHILGIGGGWAEGKGGQGGAVVFVLKPPFEDDAGHSHVSALVIQGLCRFVDSFVHSCVCVCASACFFMFVNVCGLGHASLCTLICVAQTSC